jgi:hypothetical protein
MAEGTPGEFMPIQPGNGNAHSAHVVAVSNQQYHLTNSDGVTWADLDAANLKLNIIPAFNARAIISGNADLWTANAGYNQDLGIFISGGAYGSGQIVAWKESGGSAGTFSPNAAFVETTQPLLKGIAYTVKLRWKANRSAAGTTIYAGAGPIDGHYSPTRLSAQLVVQ